MKEFLKSVLASAFGTVLALFIAAFLLIVLLVGEQLLLLLRQQQLRLLRLRVQLLA